MNKSSKGNRRHHMLRLKHLRRHDRSFIYSQKEPDKREVGKHVNTPTACSCWMCGNPRRYYGHQTLQERRSNDTMHEPTVSAHAEE